MSEKIHKGVELIITNKNYDTFIIQQKDEDYWIKEYRLKYCLFGGGIEKNETPIKALRRELYEEFPKIEAALLYKNTKKLFSFNFKNIFRKPCKTFIYETILKDSELKMISKNKVKEGKRGILIKRNKLDESSFFIETWTSFKKYLDLKRT